MTGIFFTARLGSTRLAQKHLIEVSGKSFLNWLVDRFLDQFHSEITKNEVRIFITTSEMQINKGFENYFKDQEVSIYYGSDINIPLRHLNCAEMHSIENIIAIDGDDILCSTQAARQVLTNLLSGHSIVKTASLPLGMNVMGYKTKYLKEALLKNRHIKLETGWGKIFDGGIVKVIPMEGIQNSSGLRMTLDYSDDAIFFTEVISKIGDEVIKMNDSDLVNTILLNNWGSINGHLNNEYWENFNKQKAEEI